jgi:gliding motility-associated-like protein
MKILVKVLPEFRFWIPNAFTPGNKDGLNDVFKPIAIGVEDYTFLIFNRWGEQIYKTNDPESGWNGTYKGKPCTDDVYIWKCEFKNIVSQENESHVGHVTLVR